MKKIQHVPVWLRKLALLIMITLVAVAGKKNSVINMI
jgi:hypothetical protein